MDRLSTAFCRHEFIGEEVVKTKFAGLVHLGIDKVASQS
jgi:hypothetical protein